MLFVASFAVTELTPPSFKANAASMLLLLAAGLTAWTRIDLPVSEAVADALFFGNAALWVAFLLYVAPKWVREIKAAARD
ncbi:hypothetical protein SAMN05428950_101901 [Sphingomonas sp. OV641]|nr:hypothetical protein SAMN05428950_101901 [Sphingomonas sp. OV641]